MVVDVDVRKRTKIIVFGWGKACAGALRHIATTYPTTPIDVLVVSHAGQDSECRLDDICGDLTRLLSV